MPTNDTTMMSIRPHDGVQSGFSLIELMIVVAILGILAGIAIPAFNTMIGNMRVKTVTSDLVSDLAYARVEAIKRGGRVGIAMNGTWAGGWMVFVDSGRDGYTAGADNAAAAVLKTHPALRNTMSMCGKDSAGAAVTLDSVTYGGDGRLRVYDAGTLVTNASGILITNSAGSPGGRSRMIDFSPTGRVSVQTSSFASEACS